MTLTLNIPEDVYRSLLKQAGDVGRTPEELAREWLAATVRRIAEDPLMQLAGAFECDVTDVGERHDEYIGEALRREMSGRDDG